MQVTVSCPEHWDNIYSMVKDLAKDRPVNITFEQVKRPKTKKQLGFLFGAIITNLQFFYQDTDGELYDNEDLKDMLYDEVGVFEKKTFPNNKTQIKVKTLSKMSIDEASEFINKVLNYIDNDTDCILSPDVRYTWVHSISEEYLRGLPEPPVSCKPYLSSLRMSFCIKCGVYGCQPHHIRTGKYAGMAQKSPDWLTLPLCHSCHDSLSEPDLFKSIRHIMGGLSIQDFCKACFYRWYQKK